jgi:Cu+-exporting ATPase
MVTGESRPVLKEPGHVAMAGTINLSGALHVRATHVGSDTALSQVRGFGVLGVSVITAKVV